jgi:ABC-2 type transport system ATP-binding protein
MHEPQLLILDEPTTGVDPVSRREFWRLLYQLPARGVTLLISTPYLDEAERCHRLGFMSQGRLLAIDTPIGLLGRMPDSMVEIRTAARAPAWRWLKSRPEVRWVDMAGGALRVAFDADAPAMTDGAALGHGLAADGIPVEACDPVAPHLSDVFTSLAESGGPA